jgi:hypothetical protein
VAGAETTKVSVRPTGEAAVVPMRVVWPDNTAVRAPAVTPTAAGARALAAFTPVRAADSPETTRIVLPFASKLETTLTVCALVAAVRRTMERTDRKGVLSFMASLR